MLVVEPVVAAAVEVNPEKRGEVTVLLVEAPNIVEVKETVADVAVEAV